MQHCDGSAMHACSAASGACATDAQAIPVIDSQLHSPQQLTQLNLVRYMTVASSPRSAPRSAPPPAPLRI